MRAFHRVLPLIVLGAAVVAGGRPLPAAAQQPPTEASDPASPPDEPAPTRAPVEEQPEVQQAGIQLEDLRTRGGLTADEAARRAVETAPSVEQARAAALAAEAGADRAFLGVLPRVDLTASYTRLSDIDQPTLTGQGTDELDALIAGVADEDSQTLFRALTQFEFPVILNQYLFRASVTYPLTDLFLTTLPGYRAARTAQQAQEVQVRVRRQAVALDAREAFYAYARAKGALRVAEASLAQARSQKRQVEDLVSAGAAARVDALRAQARFASARGAVARARGGLAVAERSLRTLLHLPPDARLEVGQDLSDLPPEPDAGAAELVARAKQERAEVKALRLMIEARHREARAAAGGQWPRLSVRGQFDYANPNPRIIPQEEEFRESWEVGVVLSWSPNDLADARAAAAEARAQAMKAEADLEALEDGVEREVVRSYENLQTAREALEAARAGIEAAEESYRVRFRQLQAGAAVTTDLVDADTELTQARLELLDAAIDVHLAHARLRRAVTGELP